MGTAKEAFGAQSPIFDQVYGSSVIVNYKRERTRPLLLKYLGKNAEVLEINAGTGEDALYFSEQGHRVLATDVSGKMLSRLEGKRGEQQIVTKELSYHDLAELKPQTFDGVFSNLGGLNCTDKLDHVLEGIDEVTAKGSVVCLTIMPPNCWWEWLWVFRGSPKKAFRRWEKSGAPSHVEGVVFKSWYYNPSYVIKNLQNFKVLKVEALCLVVPPEFWKRFVEKRPILLKILIKVEAVIKTWPILNRLGDYYIIVLQKK